MKHLDNNECYTDTAGSPPECVAYRFKRHSEDLHVPTEFPWECGAVGPAWPTAAPTRRASLHTSSPTTTKTNVSTAICAR